ncbi:MAG TPA: Fe2+-dependent dioxygenase [Polyangiaceae bacterium]|jgi:PKHD-type hydroxylase
MSSVLTLEGVLSSEELKSLAAQLERARFVDGAASAGGDARQQKRVLQLDRAGDIQREPGELVVRALLRHALLQAAVLPKSTRHPNINRYEPGMHYGLHLDSPIMTGAVTTRSDVSITVFLNEPESYGGGELRILRDGAVLELKGRAGDAVIYPADSLHEVKPVTSGVRLVAVTWCQSMIRDAAQRALAFDLGRSILRLETERVDSDLLHTLRRCHRNLLRMWIEI